MGARNVWIVCPCLYDVPNFKRLRLEASAALDAAFPDLGIRFVLVDDSGGVDLTVRDLAQYSNVVTLSMPYNMGHQAALVYALRSLGKAVLPTDLVVTMDSDGEDRPGDISVLLAPLLQDQVRLSQISLARRTSRYETPLFKLCYFFFKILFRVLTGTVIRNGNFIAFRGWFLKEVIYHPHFDQCYASSFVSLPLQTNFVPLPRGRRYSGTSKMGSLGLLKHGLRMLMPFTEQIATRGLVGCGAVFMMSGLGALLLAGCSKLGMIITLCSAFFSASGLAFCFLVFATSSQTKAGSLRRLHEKPH